VLKSKTLNQLFERDASRARKLLLFGAFIYPVWGYLTKLKYPENIDPLWLRGTISVLFLLVFWWTYKLEKAKTSKAVEMMGWVLTLHSFFLCFSNGFGYTQFCGLLILGSAMFSLIQTRATALLYVAMYVSLASLSLSLPNSQVDATLILISTVTLSIIGTITLWTRLEAYDVLIQEELRNSVFFSAMREGAMLYKNNGVVYWHNDAVVQIMGLSEEELTRKADRPYYFKAIAEDGSELDPKDTAVARCLLTGKAQPEETVGIYIHENKVRWVRLCAQPFMVPGDELPGALCTFADVTEEKLQKDKLVEQQGLLAASAKMTALGEMAAGIAHEINNPLTIITGKAAVALKGLNQETVDKAKTSEHLHRIISTVDRISKIVHGMKNFARDSSHDSFVRTNLGELIEDTFNLYFEKFSNAQCEIYRDMQENLYFDGRGSEVQQVFLNLLQNALDATENRTEKWIKVRTYKSGSSIVLEVTDSGEGIPAHIRTKIMQPFFTTKAVGKGTGLGLSISQNIIKNHKGTFELLDTPTTTFRITLPKAEVVALKRAA
jgi:nitrogen-specific signal transduction histidine kinase